MKRTVLIVEDMAIIRDPIAATLTAAGYQAVRAADGQAALDALRQWPAELILLDVHMPVMDGLTFLRELRANPVTREIPVIMLSGAGDRSVVLQAAKFGILGYILKSNFSLKDLLAKVTQHFDSQSRVNATVEQWQKSEAAPADPWTGIQYADDSPEEVTHLIPTRSNAKCKEQEIPSLLTREESLGRARRALHERTLSGVVSEVITQANSQTDLAELATKISRDAVLSARVLQIAGSSAYGFAKGKVKTLGEAVRIIGRQAVRDIAAAMGVYSMMPESDSHGFNLLRCWQHSFAVATLCGRLAPKQEAGVAYLVGLCHDLGEILFHSRFAQEYEQVLHYQQLTSKPRHEVEKIVLGISRGELMEFILKCVKLPPTVSAPIEEFHANRTFGAGESPLARLLSVCELYANGMLLASSNESPIRPLTRSEVNAAAGAEDPPPLDQGAMRRQILELTALLSKFPKKEQDAVLAGPYSKKPVRVWLARADSLSSLDPIQTALALLADVTVHDVLPVGDDLAEYDALIVAAPSTTTPGFTSSDLRNGGGRKLPMLRLVERIETEPNALDSVLWPIPLSKLAEFVETTSDDSHRPVDERKGEVPVGAAR